MKLHRSPLVALLVPVVLAFQAPAQDIPGRKSLRIIPSQWGYCNRNTHPVDMLATCEDWEQVRTSSEMASRIR